VWRFFTTTDILFRFESNGSFSRYLCEFSNLSNVNPAFLTSVRMAPSVGSPMSVVFFLSSVSFESEQSVPVRQSRRRLSAMCGYFFSSSLLIVMDPEVGPWGKMEISPFVS